MILKWRSIFIFDLPHDLDIVGRIDDVDELLDELEWQPTHHGYEEYLQHERAVDVSKVKVLVQQHYRNEVNKG